MGSSHSILIIDDEPYLRRSLGLILQRAGYSVTTAANASEAMQLLKPIDPEGILSRVESILSEHKPMRRREITTQLQDLLTELQSMDGLELQTATPTTITHPQEPARYIRCGELILDRHTHSVQYKGSSTSMPPSTFDYLVTLARHSPQPVTYEQLVM